MTLSNLKNWFLKFLQRFDRCIAKLLIWLLIQIRPLFGPPNVCPFNLGCTQFAILQFENNCIAIALWHTNMRLLRCNPVTVFFYRSSLL